MKKIYYFLLSLFLCVCLSSLINLSANEACFGISYNPTTGVETKITYEEYNKYNNSINTCGVIDTDDRYVIRDTTDAHYKAVCYVLAYYGKDCYRGSGILVGKKVLLTASHLLYNKERGWASSVVVYPAYNNGDAPYGGALWAYTSIGKYYDTKNENDDWGIVKLATSIGEKTGYYNISTTLKKGDKITLFSYPSDMSTKMVVSPSTVTSLYTYKFRHKCDLVGGSSGGGILNSNLEVVGIQSTETYTETNGVKNYMYNTACRISKYIVGYVAEANS